MTVLSEWQCQVRRGLDEYSAKVVLDTLECCFGVGLEAQRDHRRGVAGASKAKTIGVFHTQSVQRDDINRIGKVSRISQLRQQRVVLTFIGVDVQLRCAESI